jgi:hypothetical protein
MASVTYREALELAQLLSDDDRLSLIRELRSNGDRDAGSEQQSSIVELRGLGEEIWQQLDAQEYVNRERSSWIG